MKKEKYFFQTKENVPDFCTELIYLNGEPRTSFEVKKYARDVYSADFRSLIRLSRKRVPIRHLFPSMFLRRDGETMLKTLYYKYKGVARGVCVGKGIMFAKFQEDNSRIDLLFLISSKNRFNSFDSTEDTVDTFNKESLVRALQNRILYVATEIFTEEKYKNIYSKFNKEVLPYISKTNCQIVILPSKEIEDKFFRQSFKINPRLKKENFGKIMEILKKTLSYKNYMLLNKSFDPNTPTIL